MKKALSLLLSFAMLLSITAGFGTTAFAGKTMTMYVNQTDARKILPMINDLRKNDAWYWDEDDTDKVYVKNLKALKYDYDLEKIAIQRACEIAIEYGHTRPNGENGISAFDDLGYDYVLYRGKSWATCRGENICYISNYGVEEYDASEYAHYLWTEEDCYYEDQGHRRAMLDENYAAVGIGHVLYDGVHYLTEVFAMKTNNTKKTKAMKKEVTVTTDKKGNVYVSGISSKKSKSSNKNKPKSTSITKLQSGKDYITVYWKKASKISGCQIELSRDEDFENSAKLNVNSATKTKQKVINAGTPFIKSGKKYYVRIRTYKKSKGKKVYSSWSKTKSIKTK